MDRGVTYSIVAPPGAETIQVGLVGVMELYNYVQEIIHSPLTRQALLRDQHGKLVDEALDWSVTLQDAWGTDKDKGICTDPSVCSPPKGLRLKQHLFLHFLPGEGEEGCHKMYWVVAENGKQTRVFSSLKYRPPPYGGG